MSDPLRVTMQLCERCGGDGKLYTSRYGGNDPDVWPIGDCPECEGTAYVLIETEDVGEEEIMATDSDGALAELFRLMDEADDALDKDTYEQFRKDGFDPPNDADYSVCAGTVIKCNKVFQQIERIRRAHQGEGP